METTDWQPPFKAYVFNTFSYSELCSLKQFILTPFSPSVKQSLSSTKMKSLNSSHMRQIMSKTNSAARGQVGFHAPWAIKQYYTLMLFPSVWVVIECFGVLCALQTSVITLWKCTTMNFDNIWPWLLSVQLEQTYRALCWIVTRLSHGSGQKM